MALLFCDGFEDGLGDWTAAGASTTTTNARNGFSATGPTNQQLFRTIPQLATVIVGWAQRLSQLPPSSDVPVLCLLGDAGVTSHVGIAIRNDGAIYGFRNTTATNLGVATSVFIAAQWQYIEAKITLHDTTGSILVKVDGTIKLNLTNVDTKNAGTLASFDRVRLQTNNTGTTLFDDVYICDTTGSYNNDFLGDLAVEHIRPIGNDTSQWVGSDADSVNNFALVNEAGTAVTTTYTGSAVVGNRDLYTVPGSVRGAGTIHGVYTVASMAKSDAGAKSAALCIKEGSGGTPRTGTSQALTTGYLNYGQAYDRKADGSAWTFADLQALRIGAEVTA